MALALYLITTAAVSFLWSRFVQRVSVAAAIALIALPLVFTGKAMLTGRVYAPIDLPFTAEPLRDYARDFGVARPHEIALSDLHCQIIPWQKAVRWAWSQGEWPLWNPFILNGDILAAAAQPAVYDPLQLLGFLLPLPDALTFGASMTFFIAAFFTFAFARATGLKEIAALVAAAGFTFCGMMAFFVGWPLARTWAWLPLVLFAVRERRWVLLTAAFVLVIFSGHPESVLHVVAVGAVYGVGLKPDLRSARSAFFAGLMALALGAIYLLPFAEAAPETLEYKIRRELYAPTSYDVIVSPEVRRERMVKTFVPFSHGESNRPGWDPLSARVGVVVMLLAVAALFQRRAWGWGVMAVVCLLATFGTWPVAHALHALPLFDIAINERLAFAAAFAMAMLAAMAVDRIPKRGFAIALLALVLLERVNEDGDFYPALDKRVFYPRVPLLASIPKDARFTGAGSALIPNNAALYELEDARGYQAMTFVRLYETYPLWSRYQRAWFNAVDDLSRPFLSFLNIRYALAHGNVAVPPGWSVRAADRDTRLLENPRVLPRAFVPERVRYVRGNAAEEMKNATEFASTVWIETDAYEPHDAPNGAGRVSIRRRGLEYELEATMQRAGWVVISETHWPGWRAYVDGRAVRPHYANHAFLGVYVPAGAHRVRLVYLPESFTRGRAISAVALLVAVLLVARGARRSR
ncbi:MAG TPA: YfhO family protein [Thermoanaerobaculia bacterium]|nr:YfhO family protein [Thermoanaerobaculia bacterium]